MADESSQSPIEAPRIIVVPPGQTIIPPAQQEAMRTLANHLATLLDNAFEIPGTKYRFGLDPIIGLIPVVGDLIAMLIGSYIVVLAGRLGVPRPVIWRMLVNLGIDMAIGSIPVIGDLLDVAWKANAMNARLLNRALDDPRSASRASVWALIGLSVLLIALLVGGILLGVWVLKLLVHAIR
ncbi:MAG TPA: DUF4112 domain-containing protein [Gemmataceae bacterium]|jgi:hypothetical protein|nr:DUF4112 domain-containing protein [Gemmataceae bacterium]